MHFWSNFLQPVGIELMPLKKVKFFPSEPKINLDNFIHLFIYNLKLTLQKIQKTKKGKAIIVNVGKKETLDIVTLIVNIRKRENHHWVLLH